MKKKTMLYGAALLTVVGVSGYYFTAQPAAASKEVSQEVLSQNNVPRNIEKNVVSYAEGQKTDLQTLMTNAIDNYTTLQGTYYVKYLPINVNQTVSFTIDLANQSAYVEDETNGQKRIIKQKGQDAVTDEGAGNVSKYKVAVDKQAIESQKTKLKDIHTRFEKADGVFRYKYRSNPVASRTDDVTFPQQFALGYLRDHQKWSIVGTENYLGRTAVKIQGEMPLSLQKKHDAVKFEALVDQETGIILKQQEFNTAGDVTNEIAVTSLKVNQPVDTSFFSVN